MCSHKLHYIYACMADVGRGCVSAAAGRWFANGTKTPRAGLMSALGPNVLQGGTNESRAQKNDQKKWIKTVMGGRLRASGKRKPRFGLGQSKRNLTGLGSREGGS